MKLYHGTSGSSYTVKRILREGLKPRGRRRGNWAERAPSHQDCVYLTDVYSGYFAICAAGEDRKCAVFEVDMDSLFEADMLPDEDFMAQVAHQAGNKSRGEDLLAITASYRKDLLDWLGHPEAWKKSLENLGTCAHFSLIPPHAITRYVVFDLSKNTHLPFVFDPTISLANYRLLAGRYRMYTARLFDDEVVAPENDFMCGPADAEFAKFERNDFRVVDLRNEWVRQEKQEA